MKQTKLYTISQAQLSSLPDRYRVWVIERILDLGLAPMTILERDWQDIEFNLWCDEKAKGHYE